MREKGRTGPNAAVSPPSPRFPLEAPRHKGTLCGMSRGLGVLVVSAGVFMCFGELKLPKSAENVVVRHLERKDLDELYTIETDPEVKRYLHGPVSTPREEWILGMASRLTPSMGSEFSQCVPFAVVARDGLRFAGRAAIPVSGLSEHEIQVVISKDYWRRHFGRDVCRILIGAAFDELVAERVVGVVHPENSKSLNLLQSLGFEKDGIISDRSKQDGYLKFVLSRTEYQERLPL